LPQLHEKKESQSRLDVTPPALDKYWGQKEGIQYLQREWVPSFRDSSYFVLEVYARVNLFIKKEEREDDHQILFLHSFVRLLHFLCKHFFIILYF